MNAKITAYVPGDLINIDKDMIGIIVEGAVMIKTHPGSDLTKPVTLHKALEGNILGFTEGESFGGITLDNLTWLIVHGTQTEVVWMKRIDFDKLWNLQKKDIVK